MKQAIDLVLVLVSACAPIPINRLSPYPANGQTQEQLIADSNACDAFAY